MKRVLFLLICLSWAHFVANAQRVETPQISPTAISLYDRSMKRTEIILPKIKGFNCYKADFHMHTIYSDGDVTPRERVREAWYDGLDIIAITDHLEIRTYEKFMLKALEPYSKSGEPFVYANAGAGNKKDKSAPMLSNLNAAYDEAVYFANREELPITIIRGTEIWRDPRTTGEYNAIFLKDINAICHEDLFESFRRVKEQGGLIMHNHPGWRRKNMEKSEIQAQAYAEGWVDGVEVINGVNLYPQMIDRCVNEKLTIFSNSDAHRPTAQLWPYGGPIHRTMTLVMAKDCSESSIKEAILKRRTIGYAANNLAGETVWLRELINAAVECRVVAINEKKGYRVFQFTNTCSIPFLLHRGNTVYVLNPFETRRINVGKNKTTGKYLEPTFVIDNMWAEGDAHPEITFEIDD